MIANKCYVRILNYPSKSALSPFLHPVCKASLWNSDWKLMSIIAGFRRSNTNGTTLLCLGIVRSHIQSAEFNTVTAHLIIWMCGAATAASTHRHGTLLIWRNAGSTIFFFLCCVNWTERQWDRGLRLWGTKTSFPLKPSVLLIACVSGFG